MPTTRTTPASSSAEREGEGRALTLRVPTSWEALTDGQLRYVASLLADGLATDYVKAMLLLRPVPEHLRSQLPAEAVADCLSELDFLDQPPTAPVRPDTLQHCQGLNAYLHGVPFRTWLAIENYYQGYLQSHDPEALQCLARELYPGAEAELSAAEGYLVLLWVVSLKAAYCQLFPYLFRTQGGGNTDDAPDQREVMNAQIRALTGGDVTKTQAVLEADTIDALTELDAKAREAHELAERLKN